MFVFIFENEYNIWIFNPQSDSEDSFEATDNDDDIEDEAFGDDDDWFVDVDDQKTKEVWTH